MEQDVKTIGAIEQAMVENFNTGDIEAILQYFDDKFIGFSSTTYNRITGLDALRETFNFYFKEGGAVNFSIEDVQISVFDGTAFSSFYWQVLIERNGHKTEISGRGSHVFLKRFGKWKIIHEHFSKTH